MTKKHFIRIADILKTAKSIHGIDEPGQAAIRLIQSELEGMFTEENPNFDLNRFRKATT